MIADVEERRLVVAQADGMPGVLPPVGQQVVRLEVREHRLVDVGAGDARAQGVERGAASAEHVLEQTPHLGARLADDHRPLELGVVPPDRGARLADEHVAGFELDVVRDRVRPGAPLPDLAPVARRDPVRRGEAAAVGRAERVVHGERRLVARAQAGLGLGRAGHAVLLQQPVGVAAPAPALADQLDLRVALANEHRLQQRGERRDRAADRLAQRRPFVAEDARVAVLVGSDGAGDPHVEQHAGEDPHRMLVPRILGIRLDALEVGLGANALDLELRHEHHQVAGGIAGQRDGPLRRQEAEVRQVADVVLIEDDVPGQVVLGDVAQQPLAPLGEL